MGFWTAYMGIYGGGGAVNPNPTANVPDMEWEMGYAMLEWEMVEE